MYPCKVLAQGEVSLVVKKPTPMDLDVIQTNTATSADPTSEEFKYLRTELNAIRTEFRGRKNFQPGRKDKDKEERDPLKCYNCGGANHMARHCMMSKKKEAGKAQDQ
jgi:hypothetical protein